MRPAKCMSSGLEWATNIVAARYLMQFGVNNKRDTSNAYWRLYWLYCWLDVTLRRDRRRIASHITSVFHLNMVLAVKSVNVMELYKSLCKPFGPPQCSLSLSNIGRSVIWWSAVFVCLFVSLYGFLYGTVYVSVNLQLRCSFISVTWNLTPVLDALPQTLYVNIGKYHSVQTAANINLIGLRFGSVPGVQIFSTTLVCCNKKIDKTLHDRIGYWVKTINDSHWLKSSTIGQNDESTNELFIVSSGVGIAIISNWSI